MSAPGGTNVDGETDLHGETDLAPGWRGVAQQQWDPPRCRTVIVAPHPDDEVLGCGGLIVRQRRRGLDVVIVAVTDGEAAFDDGDTNPGSGAERAALAQLRRREQVAACRVLGVGPTAVVRLGLPDGLVADHEEALADAVKSVLRDGDLVVAPWTGDHHCDHEATGRAVAALTPRCGVVLIGSLVWGPLRGAPPTPDELPLLALPLGVAEREQRWRALQCHRSQLHPALHGAAGDPVLPPELVRRLHRPIEQYLSVWP